MIYQNYPNIVRLLEIAELYVTQIIYVHEIFSVNYQVLDATNDLEKLIGRQTKISRPYSTLLTIAPPSCSAYKTEGTKILIFWHYISKNIYMNQLHRI